MSKDGLFPQLMPAMPSCNLKGLTEWELFTRLERLENSIQILNLWLRDEECNLTRSTLQDFMRLKRRLKRAIYLKRLKNRLFSLVGH